MAQNKRSRAKRRFWSFVPPAEVPFEYMFLSHSHFGICSTTCQLQARDKRSFANAPGVPFYSILFRIMFEKPCTAHGEQVLSNSQYRILWDDCTRLAVLSRTWTPSVALMYSFGCGSRPIVPFWGRCTTHFSLKKWGLECSLVRFGF